VVAGSPQYLDWLATATNPLSVPPT
jgi:hypothetical protein